MEIVQNTETVGIWTEYVICKVLNISFNTASRDYVKELNFSIQKELETKLDFLKTVGISHHIGNENDSIGDFKLCDGSYLSIKTNISGDKVCPNFIGQTTLKKLNFESVNQFKTWVLNNPEEVFLKYSKALLKSQHLLYVNYNNGQIFYIKHQELLSRAVSFSFTKDIQSWNESCTMKFDGKSIAEFQVHTNRNCVKCRFSMNNFIKNFTSFTYCNFTKTNFKIKKSAGTFNYIGSKTKLLTFLRESIEDYTAKPLSEISSFFDLFAGTGAVSSYFLENKVKNITTNDNMYYSKVLCSGLICTENVKDYISILEQLTPVRGFITNTYATTRMYFTQDNAMKIDAMRQYLEENKESIGEKKFYILLRCLLYAATKVANISSTYGAYLKKFKSSSLKQIKLICPQVKTFEDSCFTIYNDSILDLVDKVNIQGEVCYLDPPYNTRKYSSNYFVMETLATNCKSPVSDGITGVPLVEPSGSGDFCSKVKVVDSFNALFSKINTEYIAVSYSNDGILSKELIKELLEKNGWIDVKIYTEPYQRFKSSKVSKQSIKDLVEYLICAKKSST